jgi:hypothetical protein
MITVHFSFRYDCPWSWWSQMAGDGGPPSSLKDDHFRAEVVDVTAELIEGRGVGDTTNFNYEHRGVRRVPPRCRGQPEGEPAVIRFPGPRCDQTSGSRPSSMPVRPLGQARLASWSPGGAERAEC